MAVQKDSRHSGGLRERILKAGAKRPQATSREIAEVVGCHPDTVRKYLGPRQPAPAQPGQGAPQQASLRQPPAHAMLDHVLAGGTLPDEVLPKTPAEAFGLWLPSAELSDYLEKLDAPGTLLGGPEHYAHWRGEPPAAGLARTVRRNQQRWLRAEARSVAAGTDDPYPEECRSDEDRDNRDCLRVIGDLEMTGEPFGAEDIVSAVIRRRRALLGRKSASPPSQSAVRRQMLCQLVREDVFRHSHTPGFGVTGSAQSAAYDRAKAMVAAAGL